ncbi:MAG: polyphosphate polymerase domain-containing protein, partial [Bdellovibrionales bacterium]|nr:polyphosphate polymerase domain-containing protein [Bdellovibrionales bacterium]
HSTIDGADFILINNRELYPVLKNSFRRRYFESAQAHIRVTLDTSLSYGLPGKVSSAFDHEVAAILEVKFPAMRNKEGIAFLQSLPWLSTQFSKYVRGTQILGL